MGLIVSLLSGFLSQFIVVSLVCSRLSDSRPNILAVRRSHYETGSQFRGSQEEAIVLLD